MGWTCYNQSNSPRNKKEERIEIDRIFKSHDEKKSIYRVVAASKVGTTWYIAVEIESFTKEDDPAYELKDGKFTIGIVLLTSRKDGEWGYKEIQETGYPYYFDCPKYILNLLSPLKDGQDYAKQWRDACLERINNKPPKIKIGDRIKTRDIEIRGIIHNRWVVCGYNTRKRVMKYFQCLDTGKKYRLAREQLTGAAYID